jgi:hypothetical protein
MLVTQSASEAIKNDFTSNPTVQMNQGYSRIINYLSNYNNDVFTGIGDFKIS